jgi:hypothetical protein
VKNNLKGYVILGIKSRTHCMEKTPGVIMLAMSLLIEVEYIKKNK